MRRSVARFLGGREGGREGRFRFFSNNFFRRSDFDFERLKMVEGRGEKGGGGGGGRIDLIGFVHRVGCRFIIKYVEGFEANELRINIRDVDGYTMRRDTRVERSSRQDRKAAEGGRAKLFD